MKTAPIICFLLSCSIFASVAQQRQITCSSVRNADNSISIFSDSQEYGEYTIKLVFSSLMGYRTSIGVYNDVAITTIDRGKKEVIKLTQEKMAPGYAFQYTYQYFPGRALRKTPDSILLHLLPSTTGNALRLFRVTSIAEELGRKNPEEFYSTGFIYKLGDTICATRAGTIYECNDTVKQGETKTDFYKRDRNRISIQHKDGSLSSYSVAAPVKLLVKPGDVVFPGQQLAVFEKQSEKYYLFFSTYYLDQNKVMTNTYYNGPSPSGYVYMRTHFYAMENDKPVLLELNKQYTVQHPKDIVTAEMSKRDKKKLGIE